MMQLVEKLRTWSLLALFVLPAATSRAAASLRAAASACSGEDRLDLLLAPVARAAAACPSGGTLAQINDVDTARIILEMIKVGS
jgi:hypothetical protein